MSDLAKWELESPISNCGSPLCEGNLAFDSSSSRLEMERKTNAGRKKIEMKLISASDARQVTFSKRRSGLFKKASELATLCDSETAVIAFSPGGKAFSFGHPSVEAVINRYDGQSQALDAGDQSVQTDNLRELIQRYNALLDQLEVEKKRGEAIKRMGMEMKAKTWLLTPVENLNPTQLQILKVLMEDLKKRVYQQREELSKKARTPRPLLDLNTVEPDDPSASNPTKNNSMEGGGGSE
ncbi:agamous-like MADS-box protein AGL29 [Vitis vinifera]|nr:agamous-like MADS-box protein AGL29 [Vitis vinifera]